MTFRAFRLIVFMGSVLELLLLFAQCTKRQYPDSHAASCYPNHPYDTGSYQWVEPPDSLITPLARRYTRYNLMVANAAGLLNLLYTYDQARANLVRGASPRQALLMAETKEAIDTRISFFRTQVASLAAELDCENLRANRLITYLDRLEQVRARNLTVSSLVTGAVGSVAAALLPDTDAKAVAIGTGMGSATLGILSLFSSQKIRFEHPRNLLRDVWYAPEHATDYPTMVWNMLSQPIFSSSGRYSVAYLLKDQWIVIEGLTPHQKQNDRTIALLMSNGGIYTVNELKLRADMMNQLQAAVKLIDQDIQGLLSQMSRPY